MMTMLIDRNHSIILLKNIYYYIGARASRMAVPLVWLVLAVVKQVRLSHLILTVTAVL